MKIGTIIKGMDGRSGEFLAWNFRPHTPFIVLKLPNGSIEEWAIQFCQIVDQPAPVEGNCASVDEFISSRNIELADDEVHEWLSQCWQEARAELRERCRELAREIDIRTASDLNGCTPEYVVERLNEMGKE